MVPRPGGVREDRSWLVGVGTRGIEEDECAGRCGEWEAVAAPRKVLRGVFLGLLSASIVSLSFFGCSVGGVVVVALVLVLTSSPNKVGLDVVVVGLL